MYISFIRKQSFCLNQMWNGHRPHICNNFKLRERISLNLDPLSLSWSFSIRYVKSSDDLLSINLFDAEVFWPSNQTFAMKTCLFSSVTDQSESNSSYQSSWWSIDNYRNDTDDSIGCSSPKLMSMFSGQQSGYFASIASQFHLVPQHL